MASLTYIRRDRHRQNQNINEQGNQHEVAKRAAAFAQRISKPVFPALARQIRSPRRGTASRMVYSGKKYPLDNFVGPLYGRMKMKEQLIYHKTVYDFISLKRLLSDIEFKKIHQFDWRETEHSIYDDHSQAYLPHMDKDSGVLISLNVECIK